MKMIYIILSLFIFQINSDEPVYSADFTGLFSEENNSKYTKYITKDNWQTINIEDVKRLKFIETKARTIPDKIRRFNLTEELDFSTEQFVICAHSVGILSYYYYEGKLKQLPDWLVEFQHLKKLHLKGQNRLKLDETIKLLAQIESLEEIAIEIGTTEIVDLEQLKTLKNLTKVTIEKDKLTEQEKEQISSILTNQQLEFEVDDTDRDRFKK